MTQRKDDGIVYSTAYGKMCPKCSQAVSACICQSAPSQPEGDGIVRIARETKGRKGKGVTVVRGLMLPPHELSALAKRLKKICGTGGSVKAGIIEIQGDHRDPLITLLKKEGWSVRRSGG